MKEKRQSRRFMQGVVFSAYFISESHMEPSMAREMLEEAGLSKSDLRYLNDVDKKLIKKLIEEENLKLTNN